MSYYCEYCNYEAKNSSNFVHHKKTQKHIKKSSQSTDKDTEVSQKYLSTKNPVEKNESEILCIDCGKTFTFKNNYYRHKKICTHKNINESKIQIQLEKQIIEKEIMEKEYKHKLELAEKEKEMAEREKELYQKLEKEKSEMLNTFFASFNEKMNESLDKNRTLLDTIHYIDNENDSDFDNNLIKTINDNNLLSEKSKTLILNNVTIVSRITDNYINATQLCKAGNKKFNDWFRIDTTKILISTLESETGIPASQLVDIKKGNSLEFEQGSWVHPDLAIQLAQWLSPKFALQVSKWIRTLFSNSKVEVSLKLLKDKEKELEVKNKKIKLLENLHIKKQKREEYPESNVIYILTTKENKNNRIYIVGKAKDLKTRLSTYNKTAEHEVIYYKGCKNEDNMNIVEQMVLLKLNNYREQANRDRFILPENQDISLFKKIIDNSIKFFD